MLVECFLLKLNPNFNLKVSIFGNLSLAVGFLDSRSISPSCESLEWMNPNLSKRIYDLVFQPFVNPSPSPPGSTTKGFRLAFEATWRLLNIPPGKSLTSSSKKYFSEKYVHQNQKSKAEKSSLIFRCLGNDLRFLLMFKNWVNYVKCFCGGYT